MDTECCLRVSLWRGSPLETYALYFVFIQMGSSPLRMTRARTELPSPSLWWPFSSAPVLASCFPFLLSLQKVSLGTQHVQTSLSSLSLSTLSILLFSLRSRVTESLSQWSQNLKLWVLSLITISEFQSPRLLSCILPKSTSPPPICTSPGCHQPDSSPVLTGFSCQPHLPLISSAHCSQLKIQLCPCHPASIFVSPRNPRDP